MLKELEVKINRTEENLKVKQNLNDLGNGYFEKRIMDMRDLFRKTAEFSNDLRELKSKIGNILNVS